jgi:hypothetical protein
MRSQSIRLQNIQKHLRERKLPPLLFDWNPFFPNLPSEVHELIFSYFQFQVPDNAAVRLHPLNALALASKSVRQSVEEFCRHSRETHLRLEKCSVCRERDEDEFASFVSKTHRGQWLRHVSHSCAFCGKDKEDPADNPDTRMKLSPPIFNILIQCCEACEDTEWPDKIELNSAMAQHKLPLYFLLWPPTGFMLQWARVRGAEIGTNPGDIRDARPVTGFLLEGEVAQLRNAIVANPARNIPTWFDNDMYAFMDI